MISSIVIVALVVIALILIRSTGAGESESNNLMHSLRDMAVLQGEVPEQTALPTLIVAWNTGCPSCVHELRHLKEHYDALQDSVHVVAVNLTRTERNLETVEQFLAEENLPFTVLADKEGELTEHLTFRFIPANFLVEPDGELIESQEGLIEVQTLRNWLR